MWPAAPGAGPAPPRAMALLAGGVLAAHVMLLASTPSTVSPGKPVGMRNFVTRTIEIHRAPGGAEGLSPVAAPAPLPVAATTERPAPRSTRTAPGPAAPPSPPPAAQTGAATPPAGADPEVAQQAAGTAPPGRAEAPRPVAEANPGGAAEAAASPASGAPASPRREDGPQVAFNIPGSAKLQYDVTGEVRRQTWNARGELLWRHDGAQYEARSHYSALWLGARTQSSAGKIGTQGLAPTRFSDKGRTELAAHFERERERIVFSANTPEAPLLAGAQDRLSVMLQLGAMIAGEPARYPPGTTIGLQTVGAREADTWLFSVDGEEKLALPGGELAALKLTRQPRREFDIRLELWLAPSLGYLPARMRLTQANGDFVDQQLRSTDRP